MAFSIDIKQQREPKNGDLLISEPFLTDPFFQRSVVLICSHNEEGTFGFVLNITLPENINEMVKEIPQTEATVGLGGPVAGNELFYLHAKNDLSRAEQIGNGLFLGGDIKELENAILSGELNETNIRFFIGYAGWTPGQLKKELDERSWIVITPTIGFDAFKANQTDLWKEMLENLGGKYKLMAKFPKDPNLN